LADAELLILLEVDVSDVDLDKSDDELDLLSDRNERAVRTSPVVPGLEPEMMEVQVRKKEDLDDVPFSVRLQKSLSVGVQVMPATSRS
jgi:hypothetical protein